MYSNLANFAATVVLFSASVTSFRKPVLGWNSWNYYFCDINETVILQNADAIVNLGLKDLGYQYVNIDDCWESASRTGREIGVDEERFPRGMKYVADYIHSLGLKFGIYSSAGTLTCQQRPGSLGYEIEDAKTYASWDVDYLKYDNCYSDGQTGKEKSYLRYKAMGDALKATNREIIYSLCQWGEDQVWEWADKISDSYRMSQDIEDNWDFIPAIIELNVPIVEKFFHQGCWPDMDMLEVGNGNMTDIEYRTHFSFWSALKSPLILGNPLQEVDDATMAIIGNKDLIAVNQDSLGEPAKRRWKKDDLQFWVGKLSDGLIVLLFNNSPKGQTFNIPIVEVFSTETAPNETTLKDLWSKKEFKLSGHGKIQVKVASHETVVYKITWDKNYLSVQD